MQLSYRGWRLVPCSGSLRGLSAQFGPSKTVFDAKARMDASASGAGQRHTRNRAWQGSLRRAKRSLSSRDALDAAVAQFPALACDGSSAVADQVAGAMFGGHAAGDVVEPLQLVAGAVYRG